MSTLRHRFLTSPPLRYYSDSLLAKLKDISGKDIIRVAFIVTDLSIWKSESVLRKMQSEDGFDPVVIILPSLYNGATVAGRHELRIISHFKALGVKYFLPNSDALNSGQEYIEMVSADIFFLPTAQALHNHRIFDVIIQNSLTCYIPYHFENTHENDSQTNMFFHNYMWKIFVAHNNSRDVYKCRQAIRGRNVVVTGYPATEVLTNQKSENKLAWKLQKGIRKRVIIAPHHTIDESPNSHSTFLSYAELMKTLAVEFQDSIQFSFKPHPALRTALASIAQWSEKRICDYYTFWSERENCQLDEGPYEDLFLGSHAMIHDCSSFLAEYLFIDKPVMFLPRGRGGPQCLNSVGAEAFEASDKGMDEAAIRQFISALLSGVDRAAEKRRHFLRKYTTSSTSMRPSDAIIGHIRNGIHEC